MKWLFLPHWQSESDRRLTALAVGSEVELLRFRYCQTRGTPCIAELLGQFQQADLGADDLRLVGS
jgi:hypothetical protein